MPGGTSEDLVRLATPDPRLRQGPDFVTPGCRRFQPPLGREALERSEIARLRRRGCAARLPRARHGAAPRAGREVAPSALDFGSLRTST